MRQSLFILMMAASLFAVFPTSAQENPSVLEMKKLLDGKIQMLIPNDFEALDSATLNAKYTGDNKPLLVYSSPMMTVNVAVSIKAMESSGKIAINLFTDLLAQTLQETIPGTKILSKGTVTQNGNQLGFIEMKLKDMGVDMYGLLYFSTANSELVMINFNCPWKTSKSWKKTAKEIMGSLKINKTPKN